MPQKDTEETQKISELLLSCSVFLLCPSVAEILLGRSGVFRLFCPPNHLRAPASGVSPRVIPVAPHVRNHHSEPEPLEMPAAGFNGHSARRNGLDFQKAFDDRRAPGVSIARRDLSSRRPVSASECLLFEDRLIRDSMERRSGTRQKSCPKVGGHRYELTPRLLDFGTPSGPIGDRLHHPYGNLTTSRESHYGANRPRNAVCVPRSNRSSTWYF